MTLLVRHPDTPPGAIHAIDAELVRTADGFVATFKAIGDTARLVLPSPASPDRADNLWKTTCFEAFIQSEGEGYCEYNLSPSSRWACYRFDAPRDGMRTAPADVVIHSEPGEKQFTLVASIRATVPNPARVGLTAVIEEDDGVLRYWAVAFAPGKADFHAPSTRALILDGVDAQ